MKKVLTLLSALTLSVVPTLSVISCEKYTSEIMGTLFGGVTINYIAGKKSYIPYIWVRNPQENETLQVNADNPELIKGWIDEKGYLVIEALKPGKTTLYLNYKGAKSYSRVVTIKEPTNDFIELSSVLVNTELGEINEDTIFNPTNFIEAIHKKNPLLTNGFEIDWDIDDHFHILNIYNKGYGYFPHLPEKIEEKTNDWALIWPTADSNIYYGKPIKITYTLKK